MVLSFVIVNFKFKIKLTNSFNHFIQLGLVFSCKHILLIVVFKRNTIRNLEYALTKILKKLCFRNIFYLIFSFILTNFYHKLSKLLSISLSLIFVCIFIFYKLVQMNYVLLVLLFLIFLKLPAFLFLTL